MAWRHQAITLTQRWLLISEVLWYSHESNFIVSAQATIFYNDYYDYTFKITAASPWGHDSIVVYNFSRISNSQHRRIHVTTHLEMSAHCFPNRKEEKDTFPWIY